MTKSTMKLAFFMLPAVLFGCEEEKSDIDLAGPIAGAYVGNIVAGALIDPNYEIDVSKVDNDTISISGDDFNTFEVDLMGDATNVTSVVDSDYEFTWTDDGALNVTGDEMVFNGFAVNGGGGGGTTTTGPGPGTTTDTTTDPTPTGTNPGGDDPSAIAEGVYNGIAGGIVIDINYNLTITANGPDSVTISGNGINSFNVPVTMDGNEVKNGTWADGSFSLNGDNLSLTNSAMGFNFTGSR